MESTSQTWDLNSLQNLLAQGNDHIRELQIQFDQPCVSAEACKVLVAKVKSAIASAISMATLLEKPAGFDSPTSASDSPKSDGSEKAFKEIERRESIKRRKSLPRWSSQVRVSSGTLMEGPVDDGYSWRKYGQKDILGAKFPRSYYRCTYRHTHGCFAAKQVQRSDDDPTLLDITYRGAHTCNHGIQRSRHEQNFEQNKAPKQHSQYHQERQQGLLQYYRTGLTVKTEELSSIGSPSFSFPSTLSTSWMNSCSNTFTSTSAQQSQFRENCSPTFVSGTTSVESNHVAVSPCGGGISNGGELNLVDMDTEITEMFSAAASTTSSPMAEINFLMEQIEFETEVPFGISYNTIA